MSFYVIHERDLFAQFCDEACASALVGDTLGATDALRACVDVSAWCAFPTLIEDMIRERVERLSSSFATAADIESLCDGLRGVIAVFPAVSVTDD